MRKFALSMAAFLAFVGITIAASVSATVVKWDDEKSELTVKVDDKEKTYKVTKDTKVKITGKDGTDMDGDIEKTKKKWKNAGEKAVGTKLEITLDKDEKEITEVKMKGGKGK